MEEHSQDKAYTWWRCDIEGREDERERRPEERNEKVVEKKEKIANKEKNEQETLQRTETLLKELETENNGTTNKKQVKRKMNSSEDCYAGNCLDIICSGWQAMDVWNIQSWVQKASLEFGLGIITVKEEF